MCSHHGEKIPNASESRALFPNLFGFTAFEAVAHDIARYTKKSGRRRDVSVCLFNRVPDEFVDG